MAVNAGLPFPPLTSFALPDLASVEDRARVTYDASSDTPVLDVFGESRPAASVPVDRGERDELYARVDVGSRQIVGAQIEDVLAYAVAVDPWLAALLARADLRGVDEQAAADLRRRGRGAAAGWRDTGVLVTAVERPIA